MEPNGMTYMTDAERKILPQIAEHPERILQLKNTPSEEFLRAAVFENPYIIRFVHNQSFIVRMLAVKLNYKMLQYVNGVTPEIRAAATMHNEGGVMAANLTRDELEIYANAFNVKKFGPRVRVKTR